VTGNQKKEKREKTNQRKNNPPFIKERINKNPTPYHIRYGAS